MAQINGILNIVVQQDANELRMGCDRTPILLAWGVKKKFLMPQTSGEMLRGLLGELYEELRSLVDNNGESVSLYEIPSGEVFKVEYQARGEDFDVVFKLVEEATSSAASDRSAPSPPGRRATLRAAQSGSRSRWRRGQMVVPAQG